MSDDETRRAVHLCAALLRVTPVVVLAGAIAAHSGTLSDSKVQKPGTPQAQTISIPVEGMSCVSCAARIKRTLKAIEGVEHVEVSLEHREAVVQFLPGKVTPERLVSAINRLGYKAGKSRIVESK